MTTATKHKNSLSLTRLHIRMHHTPRMYHTPRTTCTKQTKNIAQTPQTKMETFNEQCKETIKASVMKCQTWSWVALVHIHCVWSCNRSRYSSTNRYCQIKMLVPWSKWSTFWHAYFVTQLQILMDVRNRIWSFDLKYMHIMRPNSVMLPVWKF